jgi:hypothetical protein
MLLIGPMLRYVDERRATLWFETDRAGRVEVFVDLGGGHEACHAADTWSVHGHHYALARVEDLGPNTAHEYRVCFEGDEVWPLAGSPYPPSVIRTPDPDGPFRLAFGSCRRAAPFDREHLDELGADALVALVNQMTTSSPDSWPELLLLLGDQLYADDPSDEIAAKLKTAHAGQHGRDREVADEIQNYLEYTWLYEESWTAPPVRWLLSTVPTGMMLDDHDLRDDWNTSKSWREWVTQQPWWRDRVIGAYGAYWVYQHLGNLSPDELDRDEVYHRILDIDDDDERTAYLDEVAWNADLDGSSIRWSFSRDLSVEGRRLRLVAIDSRCSRHLDPDDRRMVDADEWAWVRRQVLEPEQDYTHLVLASTLPFLMPPGIHHLEAWDEAISEGAWGRLGGRVGEFLRQALDLEHWASFQRSFDELVELLGEVVELDEPPASVLMLSGDVHCSYTAEADLRDVDHPDTAIHQLTMSPFRNDIQRVAKLANHLFRRRRPSMVMRRLAHRAGVSDSGISWQLDAGPWFDNGVMTIEFAGPAATLSIDHAHVRDEQQQLDHTLDVELATATPRQPEATPA